MSRSVRSVVLALSLTSLGFPAPALAAVHALFGLSTPATGPFPSDWFTVSDASHNTRRRVNLPLPNCVVRPSDCEDLNVINTLDGFKREKASDRSLPHRRQASTQLSEGQRTQTPSLAPSRCPNPGSNRRWNNRSLSYSYVNESWGQVTP
jgi:hypothetical protein